MWKAGMIIAFAGETVPDGWADCNGDTLSRTLYPETFAALGTIWGVGDGSTTFNLPDFRGRGIIGVGTGTSLTPRALGDEVGFEAVTLTVDEMPTHGHPERTYTNQDAYIIGGGSPYGYGIEGGLNARTANGRISTDNVGGGESHANMQPSAAAHVIIKIEDEIVGGSVPSEVVLDATQWAELIDALTTTGA